MLATDNFVKFITASSLKWLVRKIGIIVLRKLDPKPQHHIDIGQENRCLRKKFQEVLICVGDGLLARSLFLRFSTNGGHLYAFQ